MLRGVRDAIVLVADAHGGAGVVFHGGLVLHEPGVGVAVGQVDVQLPPRRNLQCRFGPEAARASCVGHHAARGLPLGKDRDLLVADVDVEQREIAPHGAVHAREMAAQFVVPAVFGFIGHEVRLFVRDSRSHLPFDFLLQDVREHLRIESSGLVAPGYGNVEVAHLIEAVHRREFREYFGIGVGYLVRLVDGDSEGKRRSPVDA